MSDLPCTQQLTVELAESLALASADKRVGNAAALDDAVAAFNRTEQIKGRPSSASSVRTRGLPNAQPYTFQSFANGA